MSDNARENARNLNETINKTRDVANKLSNQYNCDYSSAFEAAKSQEGIERFSDIIKTNENVANKDKQYTLKMDTRNIA